MNQIKRTMMPRISLSTLMLLVVALAIGLASWQMGKSIERARAEVDPLRYLANELRVQRLDEYVVVGHFATKMGELVYSVHIPVDGEHELCLAVDEIPKQGLVEASRRIAISPGVHRVELKIASVWQKEAAIDLLVDDREAISVDTPDSWKGQRREEIYVNKNRGFTTIEILKRSDSPITPN